jgi:hypothetical protein
MDIVKTLKADLGGTDISSPLKDIFNSKDYDNISLGRNLFILTDGEVNNREECLELISMNCEKFKVHAIGIGSSFDKKLIQNAGMQGKGSYHFVNNVSDVNSIIIQSLSKCLRKYLLNAKLSLDKVKPEYEFQPKNSFIYPDEILNYYFMIKGKNNDQNIQINFESFKKSEQYTFSNGKITKEPDGDIIGQIIIGNILKNDDKLDENLEIKLSKNYQILSKKTSLFVVGEGNQTNKIAEFKQVQKKKKPEYNFSNDLNYLRRERDYDDMELGCAMSPSLNMANYRMAPPNHNINLNYDNNLELDEDAEYFNNNKEENCLNCCKESSPMKECMACAYDDEDEDEDMACDNYNDKNENFKVEAIECEKSKKEIVEKVEFSNKELILTQDIFDGYWKINPQTNLLIEKEKIVYENIEKIVKEKNLDKEEIKVTLLVLYYLNTDSSINKIEYSLIIKKAVNFLEKNGINFDEILPKIKN